MQEFDPKEHPHNRYNPLIDEWVLVSPHRMKRPWLGQVESIDDEPIPDFDPRNPLCPGNTRPNGLVNPNYASTFSFSNDFPALLKDSPAPQPSTNPLFKAKGARGECKVLCFHPNTNITLPLMTEEEIDDVVTIWQTEHQELSRKWAWVQIFENKGAIMGCSNPHPHCQVWATDFLPNEPAKKDRAQLAYYVQHNRPMLLDYVNEELKKKERIVAENEFFVALVPYWALWPFEVMILPKIHIKQITEITEDKKKAFGHIIKSVVVRYDNLFHCSFPYSMGWHGAPTGNYQDEETTHWVFHGVYYPPLLRSATVKKFMVGYELLAQGQRDLTPEQAAQRLREQAEVHYTLLDA